MSIIDAHAFCEDCEDISLLNISNGALTVQLCNYGARIVSLFFPDETGKVEDLVLGCDRITSYFKSPAKYFGATIGRYANRIANGRFQIDGIDYHLEKNNGSNNLHSANAGLNYAKWSIIEHKKDFVKMSFLDEERSSGFPGNVYFEIEYSVNDKNEILISYFGKTDKSTHINLSHHSYFNLSGNLNTNILDHKLYINADSFTPVNEKLIPEGILSPVSATPLDFRVAKEIGRDIHLPHQQLELCNGYDHNFVLNQSGLDKLAVRVECASSGRSMEVFTTEPAIQFYSSNFSSPKPNGKNGLTYQGRTSFCIEPQHFPNSPNQLNFPSTLIRPDQDYRSQTLYKFGLLA